MGSKGAAVWLGLLLSVGLGCSQSTPKDEQRPAGQMEAAPTFVNRVWRVAESTGMTPGQLVVFLSEGTLVFASANETAALGTWRRDGEGLTMVEEGASYKVDILGLSDTEFRIRSHNPGGFVDTRFVPAGEVAMPNRP